jgi:hypothetical protein
MTAPPPNPISTVDTLDFVNRLRIPGLAASTVSDDGVREFRLAAISSSTAFLPGGATQTWCYTDGQYGAGYLALRN